MTNPMTEYDRGRAAGLAEAVKVAEEYAAHNQKRAKKVSNPLKHAAVFAKATAGAHLADKLRALSTSPGEHVPDWVRDHFRERLAWADGDGMSEVSVNTEALRAMLSAKEET